MKVVIVGNGIAGVTAAREVRKKRPHAEITVISAESKHHWSRPALMYIYMGHMRYQDTKPYEDHFWSKNRIELVFGYVTRIDCESKKVWLNGERSMNYDKLLLATGSRPNKIGWPGQDLNRVSGMYSLQDLDALERFTPGLKHAAIVGGGLIGIELAEMLHSRGVHVTLLVREKSYWTNVLPAEESEMVNQVIRAEGIDLRLGEELKEIVDDGNGNACAIVTGSGERIDVGYVGLTAGVHPNVAVVEGSGIEVDRGILVNDRLRTSAPDVFAAGDCAEVRRPEGQRNLIQAVWYTGRMQGEVAAANICGGSQDYDSGIWFNSAKFFDLEYQVYGDVPGAQVTDHGTDSLFWMSPSKGQSIRIVHREGIVVGFNLMGVRYRHRVCEAWIRQGKTLEWVAKNLRKANFDPEFSRRYEPMVRSQIAGVGR